MLCKGMNSRYQVSKDMATLGECKAFACQVCIQRSTFSAVVRVSCLTCRLQDSPPELGPELSLLSLPQATHIRAGRRDGVNAQV
jgi:hypothetical protein